MLLFVTQYMTVTPWLMSPMAKYRLQIKNFFFRLNISFHMQYTQAIHIWWFFNYKRRNVAVS